MNLTDFPQWVVWKKDPKRGKIPLDVRTGSPASVTDSESWCSYKEAKEALKNRPHVYKGIGFVFTEQDPFCCIDMDGIIQDTPEGAKKILEQFKDTYNEVSQSGKGIHIIFKGKKPFEKCRKKELPWFEVYDRNRFIAITEQDYNNTPKVYADKQEELNRLMAELFPPKAITVKQENSDVSDISDSDLIDIAKKSANGDKFTRLFAGEDICDDKSASDLALLDMLAFWTGRDADRMERLFSQSGLCRDKWVTRPDYRKRTISKAIDDCDEMFTPQKRTVDVDIKALWANYNSETDPPTASGHPPNFAEQNQGGKETDPPALCATPLKIRDFQGGKEGESAEDTSFWAVPGFLKSFNDTGNSDYFARKFEGKLIYSNQDWFQWTGTNWEIITDISELCKSVSDDYQKAFLTIEDDKFRKQALKWAKESGNSGHISAICKLAQTESRLAYKGEMDRCPYKINCLNGTVNLKTGELTPHNPKEYWCKTVRANYREDAEIPVNFMQFINSVMCGVPEWVEYMQKVLGYALTGDMKEQSCFWLYGEGSTGKSTLLEFMDDLLGDYCTVCDSDTFMANGSSGFELIDLKNARMAYSEESCGRKELNGSVFKAVAGGGRQKCKRKYKQSENVTFRAKLFFATNEMPSYMGDYATKRRIRLIPFRKQWTEETRDPDMPEKLKAERDGIFAWLVWGAMKYYQEGLKELDEQKLLKEEQIIENDPLAFWIDQSFDRDETSFCSSKELWSWWCLYCDENRIKNGFGNSSVFMKKVKQITGLKASTLGKQKIRGIKGLRLKGQY